MTWDDDAPSLAERLAWTLRAVAWLRDRVFSPTQTLALVRLRTGGRA